MQRTPTTVAPALVALLERLIDYAGIFPPATLTLDAAITNYISYQISDHSWMLRSFVVSANNLDNVPKSLDGHIALLADSDHPRATSIESKAIVKAAKHPVYCEVPLDKLSELDTVQDSGCLAKIRTGGVTREAIPATADVARFIVSCADRQQPFKATAGLHHPIRAEQPLTYEPNAPRAVLHGFLNVLMASSFAYYGDREIEAILSDTDPSSFTFTNEARWRDKSLSAGQIRTARLNFIHSIGSCSFEEPVQDLKLFGFLA